MSILLTSSRIPATFKLKTSCGATMRKMQLQTSPVSPTFTLKSNLRNVIHLSWTKGATASEVSKSSFWVWFLRLSDSTSPLPSQFKSAGNNSCALRSLVGLSSVFQISTCFRGISFRLLHLALTPSDPTLSVTLNQTDFFSRWPD
jgi:hypothetical protein